MVSNGRPKIVTLIALAAAITHLSTGLLLASAASQSSPSESVSSSQPLWSYQVKPNTYLGSGGSGPNVGQSAPYSAPFPSLFDAFNGLSQRQGALTSSPFMTILPIILIAAGGMLLLLPLLTMMIATPFGGGGGPFGGGYGGNFGYPQTLSRKRSLQGDQFGGTRGLIELVEHVSTAIEDLTKKYASPNGSFATTNNRQRSPKQQTASSTATTSTAAAAAANEQQTANHKPQTASDEQLLANNIASSIASGQ